MQYFFSAVDLHILFEKSNKNLTILVKVINIAMQRKYRYFLSAWKFLFDYANKI
jgi:hypothetical protein